MKINFYNSYAKTVAKRQRITNQYQEIEDQQDNVQRNDPKEIVSDETEETIIIDDE